MGYKGFSDGYSFADLAVGKSVENSRSLKRMEQINKSPTRRLYDPEG